MRKNRNVFLSIVVSLSPLFVGSVAHAAAPAKDNWNGTWSGSYFYLDHQTFVPFTLKLHCQDDDCKGATEEPNTFNGDPNVRILRGTIVGRRTGNEFQFKKTYDGKGGYSHSIDYKGDFRKEERTIEGTWTKGKVSGRFKMRKNAK